MIVRLYKRMIDSQIAIHIMCRKLMNQTQIALQITNILHASSSMSCFICRTDDRGILHNYAEVAVEELDPNEPVCVAAVFRFCEHHFHLGKSPRS
mmetsp:Transcript_60261/g.71681  ORF Transcript_60261/g.71681 Transcript_60261/m.71681 type:complete len:95 (+) Transcript_60261:43-327(+)